MTEKVAPGRGELDAPAGHGAGRGRLALVLLLLVAGAAAAIYAQRSGVEIDPRWVLWAGAGLPLSAF